MQTLHPLRNICQKCVLRRLILFCAILLSGGNLAIPRLPIAIFALLLGVAFFSFLSMRVDKRKMPAYIWFLLVISFSFLRIQEVDIFSNFTRIINFIIGFLLLKIYCEESRLVLLRDLRVLILPLSYLGVATFLLGHLAPSLFFTFESNQQRMYSFLYIFNYVTLNADSQLRPIAIFWEPGVFQIYLNILLFALFSQRENTIFIAVTTVAILITHSTMGILIAAIQISYFTIIPILRRSTNFKKIALFLVVIAALPAIFQFVEQNFTEKFSGALSGSSAARIFDLNIAIMILSDHPILGIGFNDNSYLNYAGSTSADTSMLSLQDTNGRFNTNGVMVVLYSLGIPMGIFLIGSFFFQIFFDHKILFGMIILLMLSSSPLAFNPFFLLFAFSGMMAPSRRKYRTENRILKRETMSSQI